LELSSAEQLLHSILSRGVKIHTRSPWSIYDKRTLNNPMERMQMIFEFTRSHRESRAKQERLSQRWAFNRKNIRAGDYYLSRLPGWLQVKRSNKEIVGYETIPEHVATVRKIFKLCLDGYGLTAICKKLNADGTPTFGGGELWGRSSVAKVLNNRAVLGEYQPHTSVRFDDDHKEYQSSKRVATGEPVKDHYPAIIDVKTFDQAALAMTKRKGSQSGAGAEKVVNLFAGMIRDARDGSPVHVVDKGDGYRLVSVASQVGSSNLVSVPYIALEQAFISFADQMPLSMVMPKSSKKTNTQLEQLRKDIASLELNVEKIKEKTRGNASDVLLSLLVERDAELRAKRQELEVLERQQGSTQAIAAKSSKSILKHLSNASGDELLTLRTKLRNELKFWIRQITILPLNLSGVRAAIVDVELQDKRHLQFRASTELVDYPADLDDVDILDYSNWPKELQKTSWDVELPFDREVKDLDSKGFNIAEIAKKLGTTQSNVSRRLIANGRRKQSRRPKDSNQLMTWHASGNGRVRQLNGVRYFAGIGTLKALDPRLVKTPDRDGTLKAANEWWKEQKM